MSTMLEQLKELFIDESIAYILHCGDNSFVAELIVQSQGFKRELFIGTNLSFLSFSWKRQAALEIKGLFTSARASHRLKISSEGRPLFIEKDKEILNVVDQMQSHCQIIGFTTKPIKLCLRKEYDKKRVLILLIGDKLQDLFNVHPDPSALSFLFCWKIFNEQKTLIRWGIMLTVAWLEEVNRYIGLPLKRKYAIFIGNQSCKQAIMTGS